MAGCQYQTAAEPGCGRRALPGKEFCGPHSQVASSLEELVEQNALGAAAAAEIAEKLAVPAEPLVGAPPARKKSARPAAAAADPETLGGQIAEKLVALETAQRTQRAISRQRQLARREDGTQLPEAPLTTPFKVRPRRARSDVTRMVGPDGKSLVKPGWVPRWVRNTDWQGRPSEARLEEFGDFGYEPVIDPETKEPLKGFFGVAMQAPPQQYALRVKEYSPPGALNRAELYDDTRNAIEAANSEAGEEIARWVEEPENKYQRQIHGPSVEIADE